MLIMHIWTSWGVLGCPRVSWGIKTDRTCTYLSVAEGVLKNLQALKCEV